MIYKISPHPSLPKRGKKERTLLKRGREKAEMTHSATQRAKIGICGLFGICLPVGREFVIWDFRYHMLYAFRP